MSDYKDRLSKILKKVSESSESIENFESLFLIFSRETLRKVVKELNIELESKIKRTLEINYDNKNSFDLSDYFVEVALKEVNTSNYDNQGFKSHYFIKYSYPSIQFKGQPVTAEVEISFIHQNRSQNDIGVISKEHHISDFTSDFCFKIILDFIEQIYS